MTCLERLIDNPKRRRFTAITTALSMLVVPVSAATFERAGTLSAPELLPPYLLSGPEYVVEDDVYNDGETNHYTIRSPLGDLSAAGRDELEARIQELRALSLLLDTKPRTGAMVGFNQGLKRVVMSPYKTVKRVAFNPLYAVEAVPGELVDYAGKIASVTDLVKEGPRVFIRRSLGIDGARKSLARRLQVDSQTDHEALRAEIRRVGWGIWMGELVPNMGEQYIDLELDLSTQIGSVGEGNLGRAVSALRREVFPRAARRMLRRMDVSKEETQAFRYHPYYTGRMREHLAVALRTMKETENRPDFITWANTATSMYTANQMVRFSQVFAVHHAEKSPVRAFHANGDILLIEMAEGRMVLPLTQDYLIWNGAAEEHITSAKALVAEGGTDMPLDVWSTGSVSPRFNTELAALGHAVHIEVDRSAESFAPPKRGLGRLEEHYERHVEDPIRNRMPKRMKENRNQRLVLEPLPRNLE